MRPGRGAPRSACRTAEAAPRASTAQCLADLAREGVRFPPLPDRDFGGGCGVIGAVQLIDIGVPVTGSRRDALRPRAPSPPGSGTRSRPPRYQMLGSELVRVESMGTYACRNVVGSAANGDRLSEHAIANAVDVGGFVLARRAADHDPARTGAPTIPPSATSCATIHDSACRRFGTVLSPDYNAAHCNHLHLDMTDRGALLPLSVSAGDDFRYQPPR